MKDLNVVDVRNFMLAGHSGSGKTTLLDTLLFTLGVNDRQGSVVNGSSMADYLDEEKKHKTTISAKSFTLVPKLASGRKLQMTILDTPGFADFAGQMIQAARVAGAMVVIVDAHAGIQVGTLRSWALAEKMALPVAVLITGLDRENTSYEKALTAVQTAWGAACVPMVLPLADLKSVADVLDATVPAELATAAAAAKDKLVEIAAETDDELTEKFLKEGTLSGEEIARGARAAMSKRALVPVFAVAALKGVGMAEFMEGVARWFPSPLDRPMKDAEGKPVNPSPDAPFVGFVWKTVNDPFVGPVAFVCVAGGTLKADLDVTNATKGQKEHIVSLLNLAGKKSTVMDKATAGDIVALA
ncbi:MAG: GTP-binding protein, partial [bacterium]